MQAQTGLQGTVPAPIPAPTPFCSVVVPIYNEEACLAELHRRVDAAMRGAGFSYELVLVDDGCSDGSPALMTRLHEQHPSVCVVRLSRNYGHQLAITAGIDQALGEVVVLMDGDLQDPPELIPEMVAEYRRGFDVVYAVRSSREGESWFKRFTAALFYRVVQYLTSVKIPLDTGDFRLMSRRVVDVLKNIPERNRFLRGLVVWVGYPQIGVRFERAARAAGEAKYSYAKSLKLALDGIFSFSLTPLRLATSLGFFASFIIVAYVLFITVGFFIYGRPVEGWTSLMVAIGFLGGVQLICLGIIGEYLGRIYDEVKGRPLYLIDSVLRKPCSEASHATPGGDARPGAGPGKGETR